LLLAYLALLANIVYPEQKYLQIVRSDIIVIRIFLAFTRYHVKKDSSKARLDNQLAFLVLLVKSVLKPVFQLLTILVIPVGIAQLDHPQKDLKQENALLETTVPLDKVLLFLVLQELLILSQSNQMS